jgi:hypothetical protein
MNIVINVELINIRENFLKDVATFTIWKIVALEVLYRLGVDRQERTPNRQIQWNGYQTIKKEKVLV